MLLRNFGSPQSRQARNSHVNTILARLAGYGDVIRSEDKERSPHYLKTWCYRWYLTPSGYMSLAVRQVHNAAKAKKVS
jgi:hypothetical protein